MPWGRVPPACKQREGGDTAIVSLSFWAMKSAFVGGVILTPYLSA